MKTLEQIEAFITELSTLAEKSRIRIKGSHLGQGIYGKITLFDLDDPVPRRTYSVDLNEKVKEESAKRPLPRDERQA